MRKRYTTKDAAKVLGCSARTLEKWRVSGFGPKYLKVGSRVYYFEDHLTEWEESRLRKSTSDPGQSYA